MKNILLINQGHTSNIGDAAINKVIGTYLRQRNYMVWNMPYWESKRLFFKASNHFTHILSRLLMNCQLITDYKNRNRIRQALSACEAVDGAVIGGGELLSSHKGFNSSFYCWVEELYRRQIPIYVAGVSGDDLIRGQRRQRYADALKKCAYISVRDHHTATIFLKIYNVKAEYAPDVVFSYRSIFDNSSVPQKKNLLVCVPISYSKVVKTSLNLEKAEKYYKYLTNLIKKNSSSDTEIVLTNTTQTDIHFLRGLQKHLEIKEGIAAKVILCETIEDLTGLLGCAGVLISARMHAMVLALQYNTQVIPIEFKDKLKFFSQEVITERFDYRQIETAAMNGLAALADNLEFNV